MTTITTKPLYPAPNRQIQVTFTKTQASANFLRVWVTDAPFGSGLKQELTETGQSRTQVHEGDSGSVWETSLPIGGTYRLVAQEYSRALDDYGGDYEGDPNAAPTETKVGSEYSLSLSIGQRMICTCGANGDTADLILYVWGDTIRETSLANHGEISPAIVNGSTPRAKSAMAASAVTAAIRNLRNVTASTAIGDPSAVFADIASNLNIHFSESGVHQNDDVLNVTNAGLQQSLTPETMPRAVSALVNAMRRHMLNDDGSGPGTSDPDADGTHEPFHDVSGEKFDWTNLPLFPSVGGHAEAYRALADMWRAYEDHRVSVTVHDAADTANNLNALPPLLEVHRQFFAQLAAISPTVPDTQSTGAVLLMAQTGAAETPKS